MRLSHYVLKIKFLEMELLSQQECTIIKPLGSGEAVSLLFKLKKQVC